MSDFEAVYKDYFSDVYKYVLSLCQNEAVAEEITQETFFKAMCSIDQFKGNCKLYVWLCQIAKNTYFSYEKKQKRFAVAKHELDDSPSPSHEIEGKLIKTEASLELHILLHALKEPYKEVFTLRVFGELSHAQIGDIFGKNANWARLIYYRAKKQLQEAMI